MSSPSVHLAVLVVASDPAKADLATAMVIRGRATSAGHQIVAQNVTKVMEAGIRSQLARWIDDTDIDVILITGAVEKEEVAAAIKPLVTQRLDGFTDLFRYLAFQELGAGAMLSNAEAAQCNSTYVFVLPGSVGAVGTAMDKLIIPQLDPNTEPKNLVSSMPGVKKRADAVPSEIGPEKTQGGSGVAPKMPARGKALTGKNVVRRAQDDPPTKQIDVARLEQQIALSAERSNDAQTKPNIDLRKMLPRVPPGADETLDTDTDVELLAAPPPERGVEKRLETSPVIPPPRPAQSAVPSIKGNAFNQKERTSPGTAPARAGTGAKPLPSLKGIEGDAFNAKEGTSPGATAPGRSRPLTGPRPRPISVPPTNAFSGKEGTAPGTPPPSRTGSQPVARTRAPSGSVPVASVREASGPYATPIGGRTRAPSGSETADPTERTRPAPEAERSRAPSSPPRVPVAARTREPSQPDPATPPAREWKRQFVETPAVPMPVTRLPYAPSPKPVSSGMLTPPSSSIFAAAAKGADEAAASNGTKPAASVTPSVETAPPVEAVELEPADVEAADVVEEAAPTPAPTAPPARAATAPPARAAIAPPTRAATAPPVRAATAPGVAKAKPASFDDVVSTPTRTSGELPVGTFSYPTQRRSSGRAMKVLALLLAGGLGFAAVVYLLPRLTGHDESSKAATQTARNDRPPASTPTLPPPATPATPATPDPALAPATPTSAPPPTPTPTPPTPTPTPTPPTPTSTRPAAPAPKPKPTTTTKPDTAIAKPAETKPAETKPAETKPAETKPAETKPAETKPAGDPECDEVACVLAKYNRPCCERYRPATTDLKPRAGNIPEELDRAMVRAGVEKIKPAVVACGEKTGAKGTVKLSVSVAPEGNVKAADVAESPDEGLGSCVAAAMRKAQFGKSVNGGSFTYPFVF